MNIIQKTFQNKSVTIQDDNGELWFQANDLCDILGFKNIRDALRRHVDTDDCRKHDGLARDGRKRLQNFVNESGLYALIFGSTLKDAKRIKRWVTKEVLPSIRKSGKYQLEEDFVGEKIQFFNDNQLMTYRKAGSATVKRKFADIEKNAYENNMSVEEYTIAAVESSVKMERVINRLGKDYDNLEKLYYEKAV